MDQGQDRSESRTTLDAWPPDLRSAVGPADAVVARATGPDRTSYLDAVLSQRLHDRAPGSATAALELGPNGEPNGVMDLAVLDDEIMVVVPRALAEDVLGRLAGRTFLSDVSFATDDEVMVWRVRGPHAHRDVAAAGLATPVGTTVVGDDGQMRVGDDHGVLLIGRDEQLEQTRRVLVEAGVRAGSTELLDGLELVTGRPRAPEEITRGRLPEELGLLPTHVHLAKGCYPGQEAVARMWQLGRPRRRLAVLSGTDPLTPGSVAADGGRVELTRTATVDGHHVALGFVHRDAAVGDEPVAELVVRALPGEDRPVPGHDPGVLRRRDTR